MDNDGHNVHAKTVCGDSGPLMLRIATVAELMRTPLLQIAATSVKYFLQIFAFRCGDV